MKKEINQNCDDCIHYDVCQYHITEETKMTVNECPHGFKDKSRYIELPCAVGDTLWVLWSYTKAHKKGVYPVKAYALRYDDKKNNMRVCVEGSFKMNGYGGYYNHYYRGTFSWENVGKTVFLTKEEAEQALRKEDEGK
jgi:hypothetical protein